MSDRLRSRRWRGAGCFLYCCCWLAGGAGGVRSGFLTRPSRHPIWRTFVTVRTSATCSTSGRRSRSRGRPVPSPLVVFFHGGGFRSGDKSSVPAWLVASAWTRESRSPRRTIGCRRRRRFPHRCSTERGRSSFCGTMRPSWESTPIGSPRRAARPAQGLRSGSGSTTTWPTRRAMTRSPAGRRGFAVWGRRCPDVVRPAVHQVADRRPCRMSTRPFATSTASSPTPRWIHRGSQKLFEEASPINYVTSDDPPVILFYAEPDAPLPPDAKAGQGIHHPRFGKALKSKLDPLGVECILRHWSDYPQSG